ncbi:MAG: ATP-binding cassette domain-containing protein [Gemmatimonadaceae bacterium]|nr:ATP-binding cassette domain-containing protein [Gemmatimonadaceae bacterium]
MTARSRVIADGVWKKYRRGERFDSLRELIPAAVSRIAGRQTTSELTGTEFWALEDVSFTVPPGRALGIIGRNGAGKSTILKLLSRIIKPTRGTVCVSGRSAALIEVAAGFHPDLTGRENIYLQGAILGLRRKEIDRKIDEIVAFSGVEAFIDTPVKRYSSGMNARLGFSIAAHIDPDVLLIDEVLAVGDLAFQTRCVNRMREFKRNGTAIVFVSHNMQAVADLCDEALLFNGRVEAHGPADAVIGSFLNASRGVQASAKGRGIVINSAILIDSDGDSVESTLSGAHLFLELEGVVQTRIEAIDWTIAVYRSTDGTIAYEAELTETFRNSDHLTDQETLPLLTSIKFRANLARGIYHIEIVGRSLGLREELVRLAPAATFRVEEEQTLSGLANLEARISSPRNPD